MGRHLVADGVVIEGLRRGAVVLVRLDPAVGREIRKTRPAVVVANDIACRFDAVVQIVPATSRGSRPLRPYECEVGSPSSGLAKPSRLVANQLRTVARERITRVLGCIDEAERAALDAALRVQLGLS